MLDHEVQSSTGEKSQELRSDLKDSAIHPLPRRLNVIAITSLECLAEAFQLSKYGDRLLSELGKQRH